MQDLCQAGKIKKNKYLQKEPHTSNTNKTKVQKK